MAKSMKKVDNLLQIVLLGIVGVLYLVKVLGILPMTNLTIFSFVLMVYGLVKTFLSFGKNMKGILFLSSTLFLAGVLLFINNVFILKNTSLILLPSFLFIAAAGCIILFLEDHTEKSFLYLSLMLFALSMLFTYSARAALLARQFGMGMNMLQDYWPLLVVAGGLALILRNHKKK